MESKIINFAIENILEKYHADINHSRQVSELAIQLFDSTHKVLHELSEKKRARLKASALLHDIGHYYGSEKHNKKSYELIMQEGNDCLKKREVEIIANIARYHRGSEPRQKHVEFNKLDKKNQKQVKQLSAFLRIADGLDREHLSLIKRVDSDYDTLNKILYINIDTIQSKYFPNPKILSKKKTLFEKVFGVQVVFRLK